MVTLIDQLIDELQSVFSELENSFKSTQVKEIYEITSEQTYPLVTIQEINNTEAQSRSTSQGERTSNLGYQINVYSRDTIEFNKSKSIRYMLETIDNFINKNYAFVRVGTSPIIPYISDPTVLTGALRYNCVYDYETNLIYQN